MSVVLVCSTAIIVELALKHGLHFSKFSQCVETFVVLACISRGENTSPSHLLHVLNLASNPIGEHSAACSVSLTIPTIASRALVILHALMMLPAQRLQLKDAMMARMVIRPLELVINLTWVRDVLLSDSHADKGRMLRILMLKARIVWGLLLHLFFDRFRAQVSLLLFILLIN